MTAANAVLSYRQVLTLDRLVCTVRRHFVPLTGTFALLAVTMSSSVWIGPALHHRSSWSYQMDIFSSLQLGHLADVGAYPAIYGQAAMSTTPGIVAVLAPLWWIIHWLGLSVSFVVRLPRPTAWLLLGSYEVLLSSIALFAVDAVVMEIGTSTARRWLICCVEVYALYNVVWWGHPELAMAVAFLLYACLAASRGQWSRSAWLFGGGVAFQPVILLALPTLLFIAGWKNWPRMLARVLLPTAVLLALPLLLDWQVTTHAIIRQVNYPVLNRPTPWLRFAPVYMRMGGRILEDGDGPSRAVAIVLSLVTAALCHRRARLLSQLVAVSVLTMSLWCLFEAVVAPYYTWPPIAFALICLAGSSNIRAALILSAAALVDLSSNARLGSESVWWIIAGGLVALAVVSWPRSQEGDRPTPLYARLPVEATRTPC